MRYFAFEKLDVWQKSRVLVKSVYGLTDKFPEKEKYEITKQIRRSSISVVSNIAEGSSRFSRKDQARFTEIAYGSLMELLNQLILSNDLGFLNNENYITMRNSISEISNKLNKLHESQLVSITQSTPSTNPHLNKSTASK